MQKAGTLGTDEQANHWVRTVERRPAWFLGRCLLRYECSEGYPLVTRQGICLYGFTACLVHRRRTPSVCQTGHISLLKFWINTEFPVSIKTSLGKCIRLQFSRSFGKIINGLLSDFASEGTDDMIFSFLQDILQKQRFIIDMAKRDIRARFLGSYLGAFWAFFQPVLQVLIFWYVFQVGFKSTPVDDFPFILWLAAAMIPWFFISDSIQNATHSIADNSYLVKKVVFRVSILPLVRIYSALFIHLFFLVFLFVMFGVYGYWPTIYSIQVIYYLLCSICITMGISWLTASLVIFLKDIGQLIGALLQFGFWLTPIFYSLSIVPERYHFVMKLNPFYYIVEGYRDTFIYQRWFWEHPLQTLHFWIATIIFVVLGTVTFKKLRPHFADVL